MSGFFLGFLLVYLAIVIVGAWRLAHDVAREEGPSGLYGNLRRGIKAWAEEQIDASAIERPQGHPLYWLYVGIDCPRCLSFWTAVVVLLVATSPLAWPLAVWWGVAGGVTLLEEWLER